MRAVISAMTDWSAKCMGARILTVRKGRIGHLPGSWGQGMGDAMGRILGSIAVAVLTAAPLYAQAQGALTYRCQAADGKKYYGSAIPMQCAGRLVEVLNSGGMVVKRIDPQAEE